MITSSSMTSQVELSHQETLQVKTIKTALQNQMSERTFCWLLNKVHKGLVKSGSVQKDSEFPERSEGSKR